MSFRLQVRALGMIAAIALAAQLAGATDHVVDAQGGPGVHKTISAAMAVASPGDRILVRPGTYPGFKVDRSIEVVGLGSAPSSVIVEGIAFHPVHPHSGYRVRLSRMRLTPALPSLNSMALSGNELGTGELILDSLVLDGGMALGVWEKGSMELDLDNCDIRVEKAQGGVVGAAVVVTGPAVHLEVSRTEVHGGVGTLAPLSPALAALQVDDGTTLRLAQTRLYGGKGAPGQDGAPALIVRNGIVEAIHAGSLLFGGDGGDKGAGGPAIRADVPIQVGSARLAGGSGTPDGGLIEGKGRIQTLDPDAPDLRLFVDGSGIGPVAIAKGSVVEWTLSSRLPSVCVSTDAIRVQGNPFWPVVSLDPFATLFWSHPAMKWTVPALPVGLVGLRLHTQGIAFDTARRRVLATTPTTLRFDG
ncbi:MAG: hypothetical protein R3F30_15070 [Planctomycetota bacterium]